MPNKTPDDLMAGNARWAAERTAEDPAFFPRLSAQQAPGFLWIGCSDSRVSANVITGLDPGEVFVHRNIANLVHPADLNCMAVLQFAVETLGVRHIVVCGHYGCGGVKAVIEGTPEGLVDHWLEPIRALCRRHRDELAALPDVAARVDRVCELNVAAQVEAVCHTPIIARARERGQALAVHGWIYGLNDGRLRDLGCGCDL